MTETKYTCLSLFSGGMGLDIGVSQTGRFRLVACVEKVPAFCATIRANRDAGRIERDATVYEGDIAGLDPATVATESGAGDLDLLVGGPPCQAYSVVGKRGGAADPRGLLLWQFVRFVEALRPKVFVMENVRGLMSAALRHRAVAERPEKGGQPLHPDEERGSVLRMWLADLPAEYRVDAFEVNAANYGAPQARERVLFVGNRLGRTAEPPTPTHGRPPLAPYRTLGDALEGLVDPNPVVLDFSPRKKRYLAMVPPGGNWRSLPDAVARESMGKAYHLKGGRSAWWRRLSFDLPAPTVLTLPNHAGTALCHPTETRALSLRECARIQEFPDDWEFCGSVQQRYAQVGNAVPVRLGSVAGRVAVELLSRRPVDHAGRSEAPRLKVVYLDSHVRTRKWFCGGEAVVRQSE